MARLGSAQAVISGTQLCKTDITSTRADGNSPIQNLRYDLLPATKPFTITSLMAGSLSYKSESSIFQESTRDQTNKTKKATRYIHARRGY